MKTYSQSTKKDDITFLHMCKRINSIYLIYRNSKAANFSPSSRFKTFSIGKQMPGPGSYDPTGNINGKSD